MSIIIDDLKEEIKDLECWISQGDNVRENKQTLKELKKKLKKIRIHEKTN